MRQFMKYVLQMTCLLVVLLPVASMAQTAGETAVLNALEQVAAEKVAPVAQEVERLRTIYEAAKQAGDVDAEKVAAERLARGEGELEQIRIRALAEASGRSEADIAAMRGEGKGWGVLAKDVGVHPSTLGVGHGNKAEKQAEKTEKKAGKAEQKAAKSEQKALKTEQKAAKKTGKGKKN